MNEFQCPRCKVDVARYDKRYKPPQLKLTKKGMILEQARNQAPRITCQCGMRIILLQASL